MIVQVTFRQRPEVWVTDGEITKCTICGSDVVFTHNTYLYTREYGEWPYVYVCIGCHATVGTHPYTMTPLGTLADRPTRQARSRAHKVFDPLWKSGRMTRTEAYFWLRRQLQISSEDCHIGKFSIEQCKQVIEAVERSFPTKKAARGR